MITFIVKWIINQLKIKSMRNQSFLKFLSLAVLIAFIAIPTQLNAQTKANFAGTWAYNAEKSAALNPAPPAGAPAGGQGGMGGGMRMGGGGDFVAKQEANLLTVERTRTGQDGQAMTTTEKYTLDGKETVNESQRGNSKITATWSADGKTLTVVTVRDFNGNEMKTTAVWTVVDATTLSITSIMAIPDGGERKTVAIYNKK